MIEYYYQLGFIAILNIIVISSIIEQIKQKGSDGK